MNTKAIPATVQQKITLNNSYILMRLTYRIELNYL